MASYSQNKPCEVFSARCRMLRPMLSTKMTKNKFSLNSQTLSTTAGNSAFNVRSPKNINPNKAIFTIDAKTRKILIVNNKACQLLQYDTSELHEKPFFDLIIPKKKNNVCALAEMQLDNENGTMILLSGKVVEMITKHGTKVAVSLWMRQIDNGGRCVAVAEPVERLVCEIQIDRNGKITHADQECLVIFQYEFINQLIGLDIYSLIPAIKVPDNNCSAISKNMRKQKATGRTFDGLTFPLCLLIEFHEKKNDSLAEGPESVFDITVWVFQNLSGLIVIDEQGNIQSCNKHFSLIMFGYQQDKFQGMHISTLVPNFCQDVYSLESRSRNASSSSVTSEEWDVEESAVDKCGSVFASRASSENVSHPTNTTNNMLGNVSSVNKCAVGSLKSSASDLTISTKNETIDEAITPVNNSGGVDFRALSSIEDTPYSTAQKETSSYISKLHSMTSFASTSSDSINRPMQFYDGKFKGEAFHADGAPIDILYTVSSQLLPGGRQIYCVWVCRDPDTVVENDQAKDSNFSITFNSITSTVDCSLGQVIKTTAATNTNHSFKEEVQIAGDFSKHYTTLKEIGRGTYGFVKMAYRNTDRLLVMAKFIYKSKLCPHFMVVDDQKKEIPIEIYILRSVQHPNIVAILDVFENDNFFQLVMEKHGSGMDLFEFIERRPAMDEKLASYIFRQIVNAVHYIHGLNILHRDIKDENIIIDHNFHVKLIDFGSASFMEEGKLFSTFFGTTEYCSPEVLAGNKYAGPELEIWSLGVTLFVILFFENPFIDIEETLKSELIIPHKVSDHLRRLLHAMLNKDPVERCTIQQLVDDPWIRQEVNPLLFNFPTIVPCKGFEASPEKYFTGRTSSSTTVLSTISLQEVLSIVDEDSIVKNEPDIINEDEDRSAAVNSLIKASDHGTQSGHIGECLLDAEKEDRNSNKRNSRTSLSLSSDYRPVFHREICLSKELQFCKAAIQSQRCFAKNKSNLSKLSVSDYGLDARTKTTLSTREKYFNKYDLRTCSSFYLQLNVSKSDTNLLSTKTNLYDIGQGPFISKSFSTNDLFPFC